MWLVSWFADHWPRGSSHPPCSDQEGGNGGPDWRLAQPVHTAQTMSGTTGTNTASHKGKFPPSIRKPQSMVNLLQIRGIQGTNIYFTIFLLAQCKLWLTLRTQASHLPGRITASVFWESQNQVFGNAARGVQAGVRAHSSGSVVLIKGCLWL